MSASGDAGAGEPTPPASALDSAFDRIDRASATAARRLFALGIYVMLPALVLLVTTDVVLRYVFDSPLQWARDVSGLFLLMSIGAALPLAWDRSYHIRMEVVYDRLSPTRRRLVDVLSVVSGIVFFGMMAVQAALYVPFMIRTGETGEDLLWPLWPYMAFLALCGFVAVARLFANPAPSRSREGAAPVPTPTDAGQS
ncbi:MAG: TRAP transporter small permease [Gemmatimonadetes bacterium]|nr:TRAP transporter small permease [Gemmatimonadota bacterium]